MTCAHGPNRGWEKSSAEVARRVAHLFSVCVGYPICVFIKDCQRTGNVKIHKVFLQQWKGARFRFNNPIELPLFLFWTAKSLTLFFGLFIGNYLAYFALRKLILWGVRSVAGFIFIDFLIFWWQFNAEENEGDWLRGLWRGGKFPWTIFPGVKVIDSALF